MRVGHGLLLNDVFIAWPALSSSQKVVGRCIFVRRRIVEGGHTGGKIQRMDRLNTKYNVLMIALNAQ